MSLPTHLFWERHRFEEHCRKQCQTAYLGDRTMLCRVLGRYLMFTDAQDVGITPHLCLDGFWESWITLCMARFVQPGFTCVDVGANFGYYSVLLADAVGPTGRVLACEPNPVVATHLQHTIHANGFTGRASVCRQALADESTSYAPLQVPKHHSMNASLTSAPPSEDADKFTVSTVTLDQLCAGWERLDFVKIDVEGSEWRVWHGMKRTLERHPGVTVLLEYNAARYGEPGRFLDEITAAGFSLRHVDFNGRVQPVNKDQVLHERPGQDWMLWLTHLDLNLLPAFG